MYDQVATPAMHPHVPKKGTSSGNFISTLPGLCKSIT
jgi:hypothetical protein